MFNKKEFGKRNKIVRTKWYTISSVNMLLIFTLLLIFVTPANAISGSAGNISLNSELGSVSYNGINSQLNAYGGSATIYGLFSSSSFSGRLGLLSGTTSNSANLTVLTPLNGTIILGEDVNFNYIPSGQILNCSLYIDNISRGFKSNPPIDSVNLFSVDNMPVGKHYWNISCSFSNYVLTRTGEFTILISSLFNSNSTNLNGVNASAVPNLTLSKSAGTIIFDGYTDLSSGVNLNTNVIISARSIYVNSTAAPMLNKPATLTLNDIPFGNVIIWRDGTVCNDCSIISLSSNKLIFNVTGFSNYTITSTSKLETYDDSDFASIIQNQSITFNANYTNITSGAPITGSCNIILPSGTYAMNYNVTSMTYQYNSSFIDAGIKPYTIQCTPIESGFDSLSLDSIFIINNLPPSNFGSVNATIGESSSMNINNSAAPVNAEASNLTELSFDTQVVTNTWQGYYGKLVGIVQLKDVNANVFYNWEMISPNGEVYASRSPSVEWTNVRCANSSELYAEDVVLNVNGNASDSVTNTFNNNSIFNRFYTGGVMINTSQNCYATHLNDNTGKQFTKYAEILLSDSNLMIYTAIIDPDAIGFNGSQYDFEMLVGEDGHRDNTAPTTYYFYVEIG